MDTQPEQDTDEQHAPSRAAGWVVVTWCLLTAVAEATLLVAVASKYMRGPGDRLQLYAIALALVFLWYLCCHAEWEMRHLPAQARGFRIGGYLAQYTTIGLISAMGWNPSGPWDGLAISALGLPALHLWRGWMRAHQLHPLEQRTVDALMAERRKAAIAAEQDRINRRRQAQLATAIRDLGLTVPHQKPIVPAQKYSWAIPSGKHEPLVYFLENGDRIKIGTTTDLRTRIRRLALRPEHVALLVGGGKDIEHAYHVRFADLRDGNTEWFKNAGPLAQYIAERNAKILASGGDEA